MNINHPDEIETAVNEFIVETKNPFLIQQIYKIKQNWKFNLIADDMDIKTAAVKKSDDDTYNIYFNQSFLKEHVKDKNELVFVFLHEFHHIFNGDLLRNLRIWLMKKKIANIIFDIKINSEILKNYLKDGYHFLKEYYGDIENVFNLLLCPIFDFKDLCDNSIFTSGEKQLEVIKKIENMKFKNENIIKNKKELAKWYVDAWFKDVSALNLLGRIEKIIDVKEIDIDVILIGGHNYQGYSDEFEERNIDLDEFVDNDNRNMIISMVRKLMEEEGDRLILDRVITARRGVIPQPGRREIFLLSRDIYPFFFPNQIYDEVLAYRNSHIYIDVSGSFDFELPFIYKLIESIKNYISEPLYLFSYDVAEISIAELKEGKVKTSFATNYDNVLLHAIKNNFKKILIITDGYGRIESKNIENVKKRNMEIYVILTAEDKEFDNPWDRIARKIWTIRNKAE